MEEKRRKMIEIVTFRQHLCNTPYVCGIALYTIQNGSFEGLFCIPCSIRPNLFLFDKKDSKARNGDWRGNKRRAETVVGHLEKVFEYGADYFDGVDKKVPVWQKMQQLAWLAEKTNS